VRQATGGMAALLTNVAIDLLKVFYKNLLLLVPLLLAAHASTT
jgi:hypothetical protein